MTLRRHLEADLQRTVVEIIEQFGVDNLLWLHPANEGKRSARNGAFLKRLGMLPSVADLIIVIPGGIVKWLELKARGKKPSEAQIDFAERCAENGSDYELARTPEEAADVLWEWGALKSHPFRRTK